MAANMTDDLLNDDMDFMLSQVAENMTDDILNNDLDLTLSQVAEEMENEYKCEQDLNNLTISQCITSYLDDNDLKDLTFDVGYHFDTNMT